MNNTVCPNCGHDVPSDAERFCPDCGARLPWTIGSGGAAGTAPATGPSYRQPYQDASQQPYQQPVYQQPVQGTYAPPDGARRPAPSYLNTGVSGGNLPAPHVQQNPAPVAPAHGGDPMMNFVLDFLRSLIPSSTEGLLKLAAVIVGVIVLFFIVGKVLAWLLSILPWLVLLAVIVYVWQRQRLRRRSRWP